MIIEKVTKFLALRLTLLVFGGVGFVSSGLATSTFAALTASDVTSWEVSGISRSNIPLFRSEEVLELEMKMPFVEVKNGKKGELFAGTLFVRDKGAVRKVDVEFSARGNSRRVLCKDFPPFKINLPKKGMKGTLFENADDDLKFVPQCDLEPDSSEADDLTLREYTLYKMLEASRLPALKVRLAHVKYLDQTGKEVTRGLGFFIESVKDFGKRTKSEREARGRKSPAQLKGAVAISQALLKNPDWWINENPDLSQNVKTIVDELGKVVEYVSYDFDLSVYARSKDHAQWWDDDEVLRKATIKEFDGFEALRTVIGNSTEIREVFERSQLRESSKDHFRFYFDRFIASARKRTAELELAGP